MLVGTRLRDNVKAGKNSILMMHCPSFPQDFPASAYPVRRERGRGGGQRILAAQEKKTRAKKGEGDSGRRRHCTIMTLRRTKSFESTVSFVMHNVALWTYFWKIRAS